MYNGLNNDFLYAAVKLGVIFEPKPAEPLKGTAFFVQNKDGVMHLITNKHMFVSDEYAGKTPYGVTLQCRIRDDNNLPTIPLENYG